MTKAKKDQEYDPEKHKAIEKGPLKSKHINQYGESDGGQDRDLPKRATSKKSENRKKK